MTIIAGIGFVAFLVLLLSREREARKEREAWEAERKSLLDRIQHPERVQIEPGEVQHYDPPKDADELAQVGLEVPEFVQVGDAGR